MEDAPAAEDNNPRRVHWEKVVDVGILCCIFGTLLGGFIYFAVMDLRIHLVDPAFRLYSATMSLPNASASEFTATWDVTVVAFNPNHNLNISFNSLQAAVSYATKVSYATDPSGSAAVMLATKLVPPPSLLTTRARTTHRFTVETVSANVGDDVARKISEGRAHGGVRFEINLLGQYRYASYDKSPRMIKACYQVEFEFSPGNSTGTLTRTRQPFECEHYARSHT
ncbi:hypothetical protein L3X38_043538 [Prunus dulcis]|uniref:Late embryogenesis abundant protein LEA-2 subgroup domain-containing protein n=1 Tax=Prunus dulcis TaxID=3755 RepID=A0AAD4YLC7_PRUDU|nr:hypothetical protein L3X38_043538 [Prunus dulcis]